MSASSSRHADLPSSYTDSPPRSDNDAVYPMHDWEDSNEYDDSESDNDAPSPAPDFYDVYQKQRHDHYVALLGPILRGEASTTDADSENLNSDTVYPNGDSDDEDDLDSESDASCEEDKVELGKRSRKADHGSMTSEGASTSHSTAPPTTEATRRRAIILSTVPAAKRTRAHLDAFYSSLQLGHKQLQLLGESKHKHMSKREREQYLKADTWIKAGSIEPYKVVCAGCDKPITLEKPRTDVQMGNEYYAGNWNKHRNQCGAVYTTWCASNGLEPDEGKGKPKEGGKRKGKEAEKKGAREVKALPTRATGRRASLASIPVNVVA